LRIVLDANVLVRANEKSRGPARRLLLDLIAGKHVILTSADILVEVTRVLRYPRLQSLFSLSERQLYEYVQFLKDVCEMVPAKFSWDFPIRDPSDTHVLTTAVVGEAELICTLDSDFYTEEVAALCAMMRITVLDDVAMLRRLHD
jgi:putative PIN family toxin of toxin-antitoxin system